MRVESRHPGSLSYVSLQKYGCFVDGASVLVPPAIGSAGNAVRNMFRGNGIKVWDASLMKDIKIGERLNAQFRVEVFDLVNHLNFGNPQFNGAGGNTPFTNPSVFGASQSTPDVANNNPSLGSGGPARIPTGFEADFLSGRSDSQTEAGQISCPAFFAIRYRFLC